MENRRTSRRVSVNYPAVLKTADGREIKGAIVQISDGGCLFCSPDMLGLHAKVSATLKISDHEPHLTLHGETIYMLDYKESGADTSLRYGIRFAGLTGAEKDAVERAIRFATIKERYRHPAPSIQDKTKI